MHRPVTSLVIKPEHVELLSEVCSEALVLGAGVLPVVHRTHLVIELRLLHTHASQVHKVALVHVGVLGVVRHNHDAIVFNYRHRQQCLDAQIKSFKVDRYEIEGGLEAFDGTSLYTADELLRQLDFVAANDVEESFELAYAGEMARNA